MAPYDFIAEKNAKDEQVAFVRRLVQAVDEVVSFVDKRLGWSRAGKRDVYFIKGSFNIDVDVQCSDKDKHAFICFPFPGGVYGP